MIHLPQLTNTAHRSCLVNDWLWNMRILVLLGRALFSVGGGRFRPNFGTWLYDKLSKGEPVNVVSDQFASPTLNTNLANMILDLSERGTRGIIHVAGATRASRYDFAINLAKQLEFETKLVTPVKSGASSWIAKRPRDSSLDVAKARESSGRNRWNWNKHCTCSLRTPHRVRSVLSVCSLDGADVVAVFSGIFSGELQQL